MLKILWPTVIALFFSLTTFAQKQYIVTGSVSDTSSKIFMENAVVSIVKSEDSTLVNFARTRKDGSFFLGNLIGGTYRITASYPKYADYTQLITLNNADTLFNIGRIPMLPLPKILKEVVIVGKNAIAIRGDTIEYNPNSVHIGVNARVEDILVQLPGIQVDKDGKITAQGQIVKKVLVDGEEFFGDDPTLITRNIRGDMVDKIQVYDKKSDQATFTGVDDGKRAKTINIALKEDSKNGMFGKVEAGVGNDRYYQGQVMFNLFKDSQKFGAYGTLGNTGRLGLNNQDNNKYATPNQVETGSVMDAPDDMDGAIYNGQGIPQAYSGGLHYDSQWKEKKNKININYKGGSLDVEGLRTSFNQNNLPSGVIKRDANESFSDRSFRQKMDVKYDIVLDTTSTLQAYLKGSLKDSKSKNAFGSTSLSGDHALLNESIGSLSTDGDDSFFHTSLLWNKRFRKKGRTISIALEGATNSQRHNELLKSTNTYYTTDSVELIDQQKINNIDNSMINSNIVFTESLNKYLNMAFNYSFKRNDGQSNRLSYNTSDGSNYDDLDSLYSSKFKLDQFTNQLGVNFNYSKSKNVLRIRLSGANVRFQQLDQLNSNMLKRNFMLFSPTTEWTYNVSQQKSFRLNYSGTNALPSINQLQPFRNNLDPLNIAIGNPDLDPSFKHSLIGAYNSYTMLTGRTISLSISGSMISNEIINNIDTDPAGKSIYQFENLKDKDVFNYSGFLYYGGKISKSNLSIGGYLNYSRNNLYNRVNNVLNRVRSDVFSAFLNASRRKQNRYFLSLEAGPIYTSNVSFLQKELSDKGWGFKGVSTLNIFLPGKFEIFTDANYSYSPSNIVFNDDFERLIWNGGIRKKFFKKEDLVLSFFVNDILNQNVGFSRTVALNRINQNTYTSIRRYSMISLTWDLNNMGGKL